MSHKVQTLKLFIISKSLFEGVFHADDFQCVSITVKHPTLCILVAFTSLLPYSLIHKRGIHEKLSERATLTSG